MNKKRGGFSINKIQSRREIIFIMVAFILLANIISPGVSAVIVNPGTYFLVGNETYTVNQTMDFGSFTISSSYIIFNSTGFYISSENDITITLVYINDDITYADDEEKVLEFYAETTAGSVIFNLSGFPAGNDYLVKRSSSSIATPTANGSGFISFTNSVWSSHLFEIFQVGEGVINSPPVVSNIPGQTISEGASFTQINLDNYVTDVEDPDEDIDWSYSGNTELLVSIVNRVAAISPPNSNWYGVETITFTAEDVGGLTDSDDATFIVIANDAPFFSDLSISNGANDVSIGTSSLSINIEDPDGDSIDWAIETSPSIGSNSGSNDYNGSKSCSVSGLAYSTTYHWFVSATDGIYWTNGSYSFTTEAAPPYNPPVSPPSSDDGQDIIPEPNNPPETPIKLSGPMFVEMGVEYAYSSSTFDVDGDQVRFRFDSGDGNFSDWSDFVDSNVSVSMSHYWDSISTYEVRVIAQDINGLNSSWSPALNVTVLQAGLGIPPVAVINVSGNLSVNESIVFDASGSFDPDGIIISYVWDFGDGETGSGISPVHVYKEPGEYTVTLMVTDNNNATYSKSIIVTVASGVEELGSGEQRGVPLFDFALIIIGFAMAVLACLAIFFRDHVKVFVSTRIIPLFSNMRISDREHEIEKLDAKIEEITEELKKMRAKTVFKESSVGKRSRLYDEVQEGYIKTDSEIKSTGEEKKSFGESDDIRTGEPIDRVIKMGLKPYKSPVGERDSWSLKDLDVGVIVDKITLSDVRTKPGTFNVEKKGLLYESYTDSIERKVDDLFILKIRKEIDNMG